MTSWPRNKPLNQPPRYGRILAPDAPATCPVERAALSVLHSTRDERSQRKLATPITSG